LPICFISLCLVQGTSISILTSNSITILYSDFETNINNRINLYRNTAVVTKLVEPILFSFFDFITICHHLRLPYNDPDFIDYIFNLKLLNCYIWSMAVHGAETLTRRSVDHKYTDSFWGVVLEKDWGDQLNRSCEK